MPHFKSFVRLISMGTLCTTLPAMAESSPVSDLGWTDKQYMAAQVANIEELVRDEFGGQLRQSKTDLDYLQRIINRGLIDKTDTRRQQALGMVLGNVLAQETGMQWFVYEDGDGRSRALCVPQTEHCLFPVTMLSRRMAVGLYPDVNKIYNEALEMVAPVLPQNPYDA
ncbi:DUF3806 domain-containing protein [Simiduia agarivorans]|uniref:DUF3806 domain-containing protein n=1 Tax=Simiduia agarivorans (strain DSM 21679 / JCM 13881 / BCRC 17597 / SA1) TaxID=1117647 RepID=K4KEZ7_SIMAS|nr:DUF3806 domain-containing protein [Simiduia agarivorans]AFU97634.1 hypothetical protein M5M_02075 [Simiduia agarivorans SA1 = DSM 21679]